jgi:hypothetical protein
MLWLQNAHQHVRPAHLPVLADDVAVVAHHNSCVPDDITVCCIPLKDGADDDLQARQNASTRDWRRMTTALTLQNLTASIGQSKYAAVHHVVLLCKVLNQDSSGPCLSALSKLAPLPLSRAECKWLQ